MSKAICKKLQSNLSRIQTLYKRLARASRSVILGGFEWKHWTSLLPWRDRRGNTRAYQPYLWRLRYDMHFVFLSVPNLDDEEPLLQYLPYIQLGFCNDVHAVYIRV